MTTPVPDAPPPHAPLLDVAGIAKRFPGVMANEDVTFSVGRAEIHALLGENGAGKSTLVKMIYGLMRPDAGTFRLAGEAYAPARPADARARGVGMVFQHFSLFEALTVEENIALGLDRGFDRGRGKDRLADRIVEVSTAYGLRLDPRRRVHELSVGERQRIEIVRCLLQNPKLLIMDEPTSVLTPQEADALFATLRTLVAEGRSILYISHKLQEIRALCDRATVLRHGRVVGRCAPAEETAKSLAEMMIGATLKAPTRRHVKPGPERLAVRGLSMARDERFGVDLADLTFSVRGGEVLGIAGVAGNGQRELMAALTGERTTGAADAIIVDGMSVGRSGPEARRTRAMCFVPEERLGHATAGDMTLWRNAILTARGRMTLASSRGLIDVAAAKAFAGRVVSAFDVRTPSIETAARRLSGGNLQKYVMGREIAQAPAVLIAAQPTWGVDAGAAVAIHELILTLAAGGAAIVIVSQDLDELLSISTHVAVLAGGRLSAPRPVAEITVEEIGLAMGGKAMGDESLADQPAAIMAEGEVARAHA